MSKKVDIKETEQVQDAEKHKFKKQVLGKGLGALLPNIEFSERGFKISNEDQVQEDKSNLAKIQVSKVVQNPYQPRTEFDETALEDLKNSIIENGVIQPITVRRSINGYEIISGERRLRASRLAGIATIPAYILEDISDVDMLQLALIENVQREDLNPIETANGCQRLIEECDLTQEQVAVKIGKDRSTITNFLRLLRLPEKVQGSLRKKELTTGHARALLSLNDPNLINMAWQEIVKNQLSVRATETLVKDIISKKVVLGNEKDKLEAEQRRKEGKASIPEDIAMVLRDFENKLRHTFATQVKITTKSKESGTIHIDFYSKDDFERLIELFDYIQRKME